MSLLNSKERKARDRGRIQTIDKLEEGLAHLMVIAEEDKRISFSRGHYDLVYTVLAEYVDILDTRIEEKWRELKSH